MSNRENRPRGNGPSVSSVPTNRGVRDEGSQESPTRTLTGEVHRECVLRGRVETRILSLFSLNEVLPSFEKPRQNKIQNGVWELEDILFVSSPQSHRPDSHL